MRKLTVLHTNDLHGKLSSGKADFIAHMKAESEPCLLLDAGDAVSSGNVYYRPGGEPILSRMSDIGYDAMAMGNREFHFLARGLASKAKLARFPILCANFRSKSEDVAVPVAPSVILERAGVRIGLFGLTVTMISRRMLAAKISPFWFEDPIETAELLCEELRSRVDVLIALTHIGLQKDIELAERVSDLDLIVSGHTHLAFAEPRMVGETPIVQAGWYGRCIGRVELSVQSNGRPVVEAGLVELPV